MRKLICLILVIFAAASCNAPNGTVSPLGQRGAQIAPDINQRHGNPKGWEFLKTPSMYAVNIISSDAKHLLYDSAVDNTVGFINILTLADTEFPIPSGSGFSGSSPAQLFFNHFDNNLWVPLTGGDPSIAEYNSNGSGTLFKVPVNPSGGICGFGKDATFYFGGSDGDLYEHKTDGTFVDLGAIPSKPFVRWFTCLDEPTAADPKIALVDSFNNFLTEYDLTNKSWVQIAIAGTPAQTTVDSNRAIWMTLNYGSGINATIGEILPGSLTVNYFMDPTEPANEEESGIAAGKPGSKLIFFNNGDGVISIFNNNSQTFRDVRIPGNTSPSVANAINFDNDGNVDVIGDTPGKIAVYLVQKINLSPSSLTIKKGLTGSFVFSESNYTGPILVASANQAVATVTASGMTATVTAVSVGTTTIVVRDKDFNLASVTVTVTN